MLFENKVVVVTGAGSGIGEATVIHFAKEGANVVILDCNEASAQKVAEKCKAFGKRVLFMKTDVSKDDEAKAAIEKTIEEFGRLDVLINNAGIVRKGKLVNKTIMNTYDEVLNTNLRGVVLMTSLATPHLIETKGCIVNTSSIVSKDIKHGSAYPSYGVSKAGVDYFTRVAAFELAESGVRVNSVNPGPVYTNVYKNNNIDYTMDNVADTVALKRVSDPEEIAELMVFLASDKAKSVTGSCYEIDNGMSLS
ncbi:unnamed protein product [Arctia plantaginis]|uniref:Uncharacterized protein n=1 Tax=Arctia plantaginis TaxID=874455 RepID=A0A8S1BI85_ARCPL|nr:unnamed protein product [Arctia plantaginis]